MKTPVPYPGSSSVHFISDRRNPGGRAGRRPSLFWLAAWLFAYAWLPLAHTQVFVVDGNLNAGQGGVSIFAPGSNGNVLPDMTLAGANTGISLVQGVAANATHLYVLCNNFVEPPFVLKYSLPTAGNATPVSKTYLASAAGAIDFPNALAIDGTNLYVLDNGTGIGAALGAVNVYPRSSLTSNASGSPLAASRTLTGASTGLSRPTGLTVDGTSIYIANTLANNLLIFALAANGDVAPSKTLTGLSGPVGVAVDATTLYALNGANGTVTTYALSGLGGGGAVAPTTTIGSTAFTTGATYLGVDVSSVYVGDAGDILGVPVPSVFVFPKATNSLTATPSATIAGTTALTGINGLFVLAPPNSAAPAITASVGATAFTIGGGAVAVDGSVSLTAATATLATATIQITGGFQTAEDVLAFTNNNATTFGNIAGTYNATLGLLRLVSDGATATKAQWQNALQTVTYNDTAGSPNTANRTVSLKVFDGAQTSTNATKTLTLGAAPSPTNTTAASAIATFSSSAQTVALSATVTSTAGTVNAGTVTFTLKSGANTIGSAITSGAINAGTATANYTLPASTAAGAYTIQAVYHAGGNFATSTDSTHSLTVGGAATTTTASGSDAVTPTISTFVASGLSSPAGLAFDAAGNLYVANSTANTISKVTPAGAVSTFVASGLNGPRGLAFDAAGNLYVANHIGGTVSKVTPAGAASTFVASGLDGPDGLAFDTAGNLYVANRSGNSISKVTAGGTVSPFVNIGLSLPTGLAFDAAGNLYVSIYDFGGIDMVTPAGTLSRLVSTGLNGPSGLVFDAVGNLYVATYSAGTLNKVTAGGTLSTYVASGVIYPQGLAVDAAGHFFFSDPVANTVSKVSNVSTATLTATVASTAGTVNTGTVTFTLLSGNTVIGTPVTSGTVASGAASVTYPLPADVAAGSYTIQAVYNAAGNFATSSDNTHALTLPASATTVAASAASATFSASSQTVALSASVASADGIVNAGTVTFTVKSGATVIGSPVTSAAITAGMATASYTLPGGTAAGTYTIEAVYNAGGLFATSTDSTRSLSVFTTPTILAVTPPAGGTYSAGQALNFTVNYSSAVNVTGTPSFAITVGATARTATYVSGSGTTALVFRYTVAMGDDAASGIAVASPIVLNGGTITGTNSLTAGLTFTAPDTTAVLVNTKPVLTASGGSTAFTAPDNTAVIPVAIDGALTVSGPSGLATALIQITGNFQSAGDVLSFTNDGSTMGDITALPFATTGIFAGGLLLGSTTHATPAQWQAALRAVTYRSTAITPNTATRTISFTVNDGTQDSNTVTKTVTVAAVNQTPVVTSAGGANAWILGGGALAVDAAITVSDRDDLTFPSATVAITGGFRTAEDVLAFANTSATTFGNIAGSYNSATGVLTLTSSGSTATVAQWQAALRAVTYNDTAGSPNTADRTVSFTVNDGRTNSAAATRTVTVAASRPTTTTAAAASATFSAASQTVGLSATVTATGATVNTGTVIFTLEGVAARIGTDVTSGAVANGVATASYVVPAGTAAGSYTIQAAYGGAPGFAASSDSTHALTIGKAATSVAVSALSTKYSSEPEPYTLRATVTSGAGLVDSGTVTFTVKSGSTTIGVARDASVSGDKAFTTFVLPAGLAPGSYTIEAVYSGTGSLAASTASTGSLTIGAVATTTTASGELTYKTRVSPFVSEISYPYGLAFDKAGNLYVANSNDGAVSKITPQGVVSTFAPGIGAGDGLAFDKAGNLYVTNYRPGTVSKVTAQGVVSTFASGLDGPSGLAFDVAGNLYVANFRGGTVSKFTKEGTGSFVASGLEGPSGLAFDAAGNLYVSNYNSGTVSKVTAQGVVSTFASELGKPNGLAFDKAGNLYVGSFFLRSVLKVTADGAWSIFAVMDGGHTNTPCLTFDTAGVLYVGSPLSDSIQKITQTGLVTLAANVTSTAGTVNAGTVTFRLLNGDAVVGTPVTSGTVSAGVVTVNYPVPPGNSASTYTIQAVYNPGGSFGTSTGTATLTPTFLQIFQIYFGQFSNVSSSSLGGGSARRASSTGGSSLAAVLNPGGTTGKLVGYIGSISAGFSVDIAIADDNTFSGQTHALTSNTGTGQTLTFSGSIAGGVMTGTVAELGLSFTANVDPDTGSSSAVAGLYQASGTGASTYSIIGTQGQVFVLALTPTGVAAGTGTLASDNTYTVQTSQGASVAGTVNATTTTTTATITLPAGGGTIGVSGVSADTPAVNQLANLSALGTVGPNQVLIDGFVVAGPGPKNVLVRAVGPGLAPMGVAGPLATPTLRILDVTGKTLLSNSGWADDAALSATFSQVGAFPLAAGSRDAAAIATLQPGVYYLHVTGGGAGGQALTELYDLDPVGSPLHGRLVNEATRDSVSGTAKVMLAGFVIYGNTPQKVLIRGIGPGLGQQGVSGALATPVLTLRDAQQTLIAQNQAWGTPLAVTGGQTPATATEIASAASKVGAFALAAGSNDTSVLVVLPAGVYTAQVAGANNASGAAMIEIYVIE